MTPVPANTPSLLRRLAAGIYDLLLLGGLLMMLGICVLILRGGNPVAPGTLWFQALVLLVCAIFYAGFWTRGGQTLGMRSWRLRVEKTDGRPVAATTAMLRFAAALLSLLPMGLGVWWILVDREGRAWHDRLTGTRVVLLTKEEARR